MKRPDYRHAIETTYRKFNFRSRLEAKWAVFFDLCKWQWSYEPLDFPGWIPDFAIGERPTLVEVKPFFHGDEWTETLTKIWKSGYRKDVVCLGADPLMLSPRAYETGAPQIGWLAHFDDETFHLPEELHFGPTEGNDKLGLCPLGGGWVNQIWIAPEGISHPNKWSRVWPDDSDLSDKWADACNMSRWIPEHREETRRAAR